MSGHQDEFYKTMRIDIPPSLLHGVDSSWAKGRAPTIGRRTTVRVVRLEPRQPRYGLSVSGEELRVQFEARLDAREPDEAAA